MWGAAGELQTAPFSTHSHHKTLFPKCTAQFVPLDGIPRDRAESCKEAHCKVRAVPVNG